MTGNVDRTETEDGYVSVEYSEEEKRELYDVDGPGEDELAIRWLVRRLLDNRRSDDERGRSGSRRPESEAP